MMCTWRVAWLACLLVGCKLDDLEDLTADKLIVVEVVEEADAFDADGVDIRTVKVTFPSGSSSGKVLNITTNIGMLQPHAALEAQRSLQLTTDGLAELSFPLFSGLVPGDGVIVATSEGVRAVDYFSLKAPTETLTVSVSDLTLMADASSSGEIEVTLKSSIAGPRKVVLATTLGVLEPAATGDAAKRRELMVLGDEMVRVVPLAAGTVSGTGVVTAYVEGGTATDFDEFKIATAVQDIDLIVVADDETPRADGVGTARASVVMTSDLDGRRKVTISASGWKIGTGTSRDVFLADGESATVLLVAGRVAGPTEIVATMENGHSAAESVVLSYAAPDSLGIALGGSPVFEAGHLSATATAFFAREVGNVSYGTQVRFMTCCEVDGIGIVNCGDLISVPPIAVAADAVNEVKVDVRLTPAGETFVATSGDAEEALPVTLHAMVLADIESAQPSCVVLEAPELPEGLAARASQPLLLERVEPTATESSSTTG